jgi:hypothetical protein
MAMPSPTLPTVFAFRVLSAYLAAEPADDAQFVAGFAHSLEHTGGYSPAEATRAAKMLLPDMIYFDPRRPARFPDKGRALADDAVDVFISILSNGKSKGDGVGSHKDLLTEFPYVGTPHQVRSATLVAV